MNSTVKIPFYKCSTVAFFQVKSFQQTGNNRWITSLLQIESCCYSSHVFVQLLAFLSQNKTMPRDKANLFFALSQD